MALWSLLRTVFVFARSIVRDLNGVIESIARRLLPITASRPCFQCKNSRLFVTSTYPSLSAAVQTQAPHSTKPNPCPEDGSLNIPKRKLNRGPAHRSADVMLTVAPTAR